MKKIILLLVASVLSACAADVTINSLPAIGNVTSSTVLPVVDVSGTPTTKKATVSQLMGGLPAATSTTVGTMSAADKLKLDNATNANTPSAIVQRDASGNFSAGNITASVVTGLAPPTNGTDAANKTYVDAAAAGLIIHSPVTSATIGANITLTGGAPKTLDGVSLNTNYRVLVKDQTDPKENGIYYVTTLGSGSNGTWTRSTDADTGAKLPTGSYVFITGGTVNVNAAYTMVTPGTITIGSSLIVWNLFSQVTQIQAANILGQIVASQVQDAAINTAKFAAGLTPVELLGTLPTSGNFAGRMVFLTSDSKLYRYTGSAFTAMIPASDLSTQITTTQITDNAISSPKIAAGSVVAGKIAAGAVTAGTIAANAVVAGTIQAGAVNATEIAAGAINASKIAAGTITANEIAANTITGAKIAAGTITTDKITAASLSAISANLGTVTAGSLTANSSVSVGSGTNAVSITSSGLQIAGGRVSTVGDGANPWLRVYGASGHASEYVELNGQNGAVAPVFQAISGATSVAISPAAIALFGSKLTATSGGSIRLQSGAVLQGDAGDQGQINLYGGNTSALNVSCGETVSVGAFQGYLQLQVNGRTVLVPFYLP